MITNIKKLSSKINSLARKIEEAERAGMSTRIPGYLKQLKEAQESLNNEIAEFSKVAINT